MEAIIAAGLDYEVILDNGTTLIVNAEETPGQVCNADIVVSDWTFYVEIVVKQ